MAVDLKPFCVCTVSNYINSKSDISGINRSLLFLISGDKTGSHLKTVDLCEREDEVGD